MSIIIANWKMNIGIADSIRLSSALASYAKDHFIDSTVVLCPSFTSIVAVSNELIGSSIKLGAQDCSAYEKGAYTGDVSAAMLGEAGCSYVIIGHSERRSWHEEDLELIRHKLIAVIKAGLIPVLCVGETAEQRSSGVYFDVVLSQLTSLEVIGDIDEIIIAYEPVWAIGTGKNPTEGEIKEMHDFIRSSLRSFKDVGSILFEKDPKIVYGGSVNSSNCKDILKIDAVDGLLVGGASLVYEEFCKILS